MEIDNTLFTNQFKQISNELNPIIYEIIEKNNFGDNVILFYFAGLIKETLKKMDDRQLNEAIIRFMFDE